MGGESGVDVVEKASRLDRDPAFGNAIAGVTLLLLLLLTRESSLSGYGAVHLDATNFVQMPN